MERSDCLRLHVWKECSRRVYFMKLRQGYINVRRKAEKKEIREKKREREKGNTEKNCEIVVKFGGTSDFNIIIDRLDFNILVRRVETRNFVLQV